MVVSVQFVLIHLIGRKSLHFEKTRLASLVNGLGDPFYDGNGKWKENTHMQLLLFVIAVGPPCEQSHIYRSEMVNSKSFVGKVLLRIKWKFELAVYFKHENIRKNYRKILPVTSNPVEFRINRVRINRFLTCTKPIHDPFMRATIPVAVKIHFARTDKQQKPFAGAVTV